ncbi:retron Ec67 family RNA-directed DNA polymerase/endonuclease [Raoultella ornithinolytica]|uniref:retron Ec67 family RNA-directed DNA polymerase/endonuclease n=1 Tax=Raoultella ornithinolytica TaxID=54291 RepID=UPI00336A38BA
MVATSKLHLLKVASSRADLAKLLDVKLVFLTNVLYRIGTDNQYKDFSVPKKGRGTRLISAPNESLKDLQKRIADLLMECRDEIFKIKKIKNNYSFGFEKHKSIISNAFRHRGKRIILNIDLKDFFNSFNFGRVRGYFLSNRDFILNPIVATTLAKAACYKGSLPQGSPCSPVITNFICSIMDMRLAKLAKSLGCSYSRYADDITFSTNKKEFPIELAISHHEGVVLGSVLVREVKRAGFDINDAKTRLSYKSSRQEVTGLTINRFVNVDRNYSNKTRALAHSLYSKGEYKLPDENGNLVVSSIEILEGRFGFIDQIDKFNNIQNKLSKQPDKHAPVQITLKNYRLKLNVREKAYSKFIYFKYFHGHVSPTILTEGKTDRVYLKSAIRSLSSKFPELLKKSADGKRNDIDLNIFKSDEKSSYFINMSGGSADLKKFIERYMDEYSKYYGSIPKQPVIMLLDNDSGSDEILNFLKNKVKSCPDDTATMRKMKFIHVFKNLYIVLTPLSATGEQTAMEDLFTHDTLSIILDGKKFNKKNDGDSKTEYGKHIFSVKVVRDKKRKVDFSGFEVIFNTFKEVFEHYKKIISI